MAERPDTNWDIGSSPYPRAVENIRERLERICRISGEMGHEDYIARDRESIHFICMDIMTIVKEEIK